jgi:hypothetical protein
VNGHKERVRTMYFVLVYENRTMKPVEIVLKRGLGAMREKDGGGESN